MLHQRDALGRAHLSRPLSSSSQDEIPYPRRHGLSVGSLLQHRGHVQLRRQFLGLPVHRFVDFLDRELETNQQLFVA